MKQQDFIQLLQERASAQKKEMDAVPFPTFFAFSIEWLSDHPWRFLIPLAFILSLLLRGLIGGNYTDVVLGIFKAL